jgi:outer membrane protein assembly factor BamA
LGPKDSYGRPYGGNIKTVAQTELLLPMPEKWRSSARFSLFFDIGAAWDSGASPDYHRGVGIELLSELRFGYLFGLGVRAGVAWGLDGPGETKGYLSIGRSF